ncbi:hypothetical protein QBC43DRAFT_258048 [Cladorrhinum sp. PSN259]|nr:hypothetical protein QBC43DRAFT_258048 [Cladorrhinum sp. PSN259]
MLGLNSWWWHLLEDHVYRQPPPPPRVRTEPMQVLCVGLPRTGTEALQHALLQLGYEHTFHGWDLIYEQPNYCQEWVKLCRKKWFGAADGNATFTAADFDPLLGHSVAVTDAIGAVFAAELIAAYPEAKVILNTHKDADVWHQSCKDTLTAPWRTSVVAWLWGGCFWVWHLFVRFLWPGLFRALDGDIKTGVERNGKWVAREHHNMIRGLVPKDRLLEWTVEDGWEPLCQFLGREVPEKPFPRVSKAFEGNIKEERVVEKCFRGAVRNLLVIIGGLMGLVFGISMAWV